MNMPLVQKLELCFWDLVIYLLSHNTLVRPLVPLFSRIENRREIALSLLMVFGGGLAGLLLGLALPVLWSLLA